MATPRTLTDTHKAKIRASFETLRANFAHYRSRPAQNHMVAAVARALGTSGGRVVAEAPTGVGKSYAYLLAGVPVALQDERKLVISSATVALQEQLVHRDIPAFLAATGLEAKVVLAKGRQRYMCPKQLFELGAPTPAADQDLFGDLGPASWTRPPQAEELRLVADLADAFSRERWDGDLDNTPVPVPDTLKPLITTTAGGCTGKRCPFHDRCPAVQAREQIKEAQIIVANHDLLLRSLQQHSDNDGQPNFLADPSEALIVLDEAHALADKTIEATAAMVHLPAALHRLPKLRGVIAAVFRAVNETELCGYTLAQVHQWLADLAAATDAIRAQIQLQWQPAPHDRDPHWRAPLGRLPEEWRQLASDAAAPALELVDWLAAARERMRKAEVSDALRDRAMRELGIAGEHVSAYAELWARWSTVDAPGTAPTARWVSLGHDLGVMCHASSVSAAADLERLLWSQAESVVLTSATLSAGGDFAYLAEATGVPDSADFLSLPSPFNLPEQASFEVPAFPVLPDDPSHPQAIATWLQANLDWTSSALVLFTSRRKMLAVADLLPEAFRTNVRVQGECSKQVLLDAHAAAVQKGLGSVIFGLVGLGEGLDLKGELLKQVVITQLPFAVPSNPIDATRAEWYEANGRNPFVELAVPAALRTLTQFCGRLVRSETDTGRIVCIDRRLVTKRYGRTILQGLPPFLQRITR